MNPLPCEVEVTDTTIVFEEIRFLEFAWQAQARRAAQVGTIEKAPTAGKPSGARYEEHTSWQRLNE
ncbi:MAG: hypothetical protein JJU36_07925 [Phycisphaeraceae bacterium]|nr:hypothetical protein [Phycisphaeraceae bacterium]